MYGRCVALLVVMAFAVTAHAEDVTPNQMARTVDDLDAVEFIQEGDEMVSRRGPGKVQLVVISLEPHELAGFVAGLPLSLLLGGSCTLVIHCDYDAQVSVLHHDIVLPRPPPCVRVR